MANQGNNQYGNQTKSSPGRNDDGTFNSRDGNQGTVSATPWSTKHEQDQSQRSGTQGGTHEQHVQAGRQSHKNER